MDIHTKFNIGDKVYLVNSHGTKDIKDKPFYIMQEIFHDKKGKEQFTITGITVHVNSYNYTIDYDFENWKENFIPNEINIYYNKDMAIKNCNQENLKRCKSFYNIFKNYQIINGLSPEEDKQYQQEIKRLEREVAKDEQR